MTPDDPRHGTNGGYYAGCRNDCCRTAHAAYRRSVWRKRYTRGVDRLYIDAAPTKRRIRALQAIGWRYRDIDAACGRNPSGRASGTWSHNVVKQAKVHVDTAALLAAAYETMSAHPPTYHLVERQRAIARARGWLPPLAWDDIDAGVRAPWQPPRKGYDHAVVERILGGDWHLAASATQSERDEIFRRWQARGRSGKSLEALTGWCVDRQYTRKGAA